MDEFPPLNAESAPVVAPGRVTPAGVSIPAVSAHSEPGQNVSSSAGSSSRRRPPRDAVRGQSLGSSLRGAASKPQRPESTRHSSDRSKVKPAPPRPLSPPTSVIVGDSIIRQVRLSNAVTHCLPGSTVAVILNKLPELLHSLPSTVTKIIVHVGCNDIARKLSELTKADFRDLFSFLRTTGQSVFISGPIPSLARGDERFSRVLSLHTWLNHACRDFDLTYIDNFNLFWNRHSHYKLDGVHPNLLCSRMLAFNLQHAVLHAAHTVTSAARD